jgi:hypothetical protein
MSRVMLAIMAACVLLGGLWVVWQAYEMEAYMRATKVAVTWLGFGLVALGASVLSGVACGDDDE